METSYFKTCYAGLSAVVGGKLWHVHTPDGTTYFHTKAAAQLCAAEGAWKQETSKSNNTPPPKK